MLEHGLHSFQSKVCMTTFAAIKSITNFCLSARDNKRQADILRKLENVIMNEQSQFFNTSIAAILTTLLVSEFLIILDKITET